MYDCRTQGGHYFLHTPQLASFTCRRCKSTFPNYNPRVSSSYTEPKMPWRCILENCGFIACMSCVDALQLELKRVKDLREDAKKRGGVNPHQNDKASSKSDEEIAEISGSFTRDKRAWSLVEARPPRADNGLKSAAEKLRPGHHRLPSGNNNGNTVKSEDSGAKTELVGTTEVPILQGAIEVDDKVDEDEISYALPGRTFLRSAAMAGADAMKNARGRLRAGNMRGRIA
ncbi:hypothetical protein RUND412_005141 [Rhizina undulata]